MNKKYNLDALMAKRVNKREDTSIIDEVALLSGVQRGLPYRTDKSALVQEILYALADSFKVYAEGFANDGTEIDAIANIDDIAGEFKSRLDSLIGLEDPNDEFTFGDISKEKIAKLTSLYA